MNDAIIFNTEVGTCIHFIGCDRRGGSRIADVQVLDDFLGSTNLEWVERGKEQILESE